MKIAHKYIRNRHFRIKHWKRIRAAEQPFKTYMPYIRGYLNLPYSAEEQIKNHFDWINKRARYLESGYRDGGVWMNAPSWFRRMCNTHRRAKEHRVLQKVRNGDYDAEFPTFRSDAAYDYW